MTIKEKLLEELNCAILSAYGDKEDKQYEDGDITSDDIDYIAHKVKFYMGVN